MHLNSKGKKQMSQRVVKVINERSVERGARSHVIEVFSQTERHQKDGSLVHDSTKCSKIVHTGLNFVRNHNKIMKDRDPVVVANPKVRTEEKKSTHRKVLENTATLPQTPPRDKVPSFIFCQSKKNSSGNNITGTKKCSKEGSPAPSEDNQTEDLVKPNKSQIRKSNREKKFPTALGESFLW
jgi:hypothetical protein